MNDSVKPVLTNADMGKHYDELRKAVRNLQAKSAYKHPPMDECLANLNSALSHNSALIPLDFFKDRPFIQSKKQGGLVQNIRNFADAQKLLEPGLRSHSSSQYKVCSQLRHELEQLLDNFHRSLNVTTSKVKKTAHVAAASEVTANVSEVIEYARALLKEKTYFKSHTDGKTVKKVQKLINQFKNDLNSTIKEGKQNKDNGETIVRSCLALVQEHNTKVINKYPSVVEEVTPGWKKIVNGFLNKCRQFFGMAPVQLQPEAKETICVNDAYQQKFQNLKEKLKDTKQQFDIESSEPKQEAEIEQKQEAETEQQHISAFNISSDK